MTRTKNRSCKVGKYETREKANKAILHRVRNGAWINTYRAYKCKFCKTWHYGHPPRRYSNG